MSPGYFPIILAYLPHTDKGVHIPGHIPYHAVHDTRDPDIHKTPDPDKIKTIFPGTGIPIDHKRQPQLPSALRVSVVCGFQFRMCLCFTQV